MTQPGCSTQSADGCHTKRIQESGSTPWDFCELNRRSTKWGPQERLEGACGARYIDYTIGGHDAAEQQGRADRMTLTNCNTQDVLIDFNSDENSGETWKLSQIVQMLARRHAREDWCLLINICRAAAARRRRGRGRGRRRRRGRGGGSRKYRKKTKRRKTRRRKK